MATIGAQVQICEAMISKGLLFTALLAAAADAQTSVAGTVFDSLSQSPLRGAIVQIVPSDSQRHAARSTTSDSLGRFRFDGVTSGRYTIGFFHPMLDSLGLESPVRQIFVGQLPLVAPLAIPSAARLRVAVCRDSIGSGGAVLGFVRDAKTLAPLPGVTVEGRWMELTIQSGETTARASRRTATTNAAGWFRLCNVPRPGTISLVASREKDSTDVLEIQLPTGGVTRGDLYLGAHGVVVTSDSSPGDTLPRRMIRVGDGRLTGTVRTFSQQRPLEGAHVRIVGGAETTTNERGEWTLAGIPTGTRTLEVRKVGYYPEQRSVNVVPDAPRIVVDLGTMQAMLDTVRVRATRVANSEYAGFEQRKRSSGFGTFLDVQQLAHRGGFFTSDLFRMVPGVYVTRTSYGEQNILMRSSFVGGACEPTIFLDGHKFAGLTGSDLDSFIERDNIIGIEVYRDAVPAQFQEALSGCGSIVIWTDRSGVMGGTRRSRYAGSFKHGLIFLAAAGLLVLLTQAGR